MNSSDLSATLLAACAKDTVKVFDVSKQPSHDGAKLATDPCVLTYAPSPGSLINSVKWNHTNLVIASAGEDKKISFWHRRGQKLRAIPLAEVDSREDIHENISSISFSNKGSRYLCSGGSGQIVRIWDLQKNRCIKRLKGHSATVTGVMYNCKDEHIASISMKGDLILHNLASGVRTTDLKDPNDQILRVLDCSPTARHVLATAGDDGSVHLWDTAGRTPKNSWTKLHSAPTTGISFFSSNDKMIASAGLDKKIQVVDIGARRPVFSACYEAPFSSLAFKDDGSLLAVGTNNGLVIFYDVRGKLQPVTQLRAYGGSEPITSLCWQRSKPVLINENTCSAEDALLGVSGEDYVVMPDPLPSLASTNQTSATSNFSARRSLHSEDTPPSNHLSTTGALARLQAPLSSYNYNDEMDVFSPLVDVHPITPSLDRWWDCHKESKNEDVQGDRPSSYRNSFSFESGKADFQPISNWKSNSASQPDENSVSLSLLNSTPASSIKGSHSSLTPPEAWGAGLPFDRQPLSKPSLTPPEAWDAGLPFDKFPQLRQPLSKPSRFMPIDAVESAGFVASSQLSGSYDFLTPVHSSSDASTAIGLHSKNEGFPTLLDHSLVHASSPLPSEIKSGANSSIHDVSMPSHPSLPRKFSTFAERISTSPFAEAATPTIVSTKLKKTGLEIKDELKNSYISRLDASNAATGSQPFINGFNGHAQRNFDPTEVQAGPSFTLQLFQKTMEEALISVQDTMHEDIRNLHIEVLRQFHLQETEICSLVGSVLEKVTELTKEVQALRKENQHLRQLL